MPTIFWLAPIAAVTALISARLFFTRMAACADGVRITIGHGKGAVHVVGRNDVRRRLAVHGDEGRLPVPVCGTDDARQLAARCGGDSDGLHLPAPPAKPCSANPVQGGLHCLANHGACRGKNREDEGGNYRRDWQTMRR